MIMTEDRRYEDELAEFLDKLVLPKPDAYTTTGDPLIFADSEFAVDPSIRSLPRGLFKLLQAWEGVVVSVSEAEFVAKIRDRTNRDNPEEEVTLPKEDISPSEKDQIVPGAVFYWSIGYKDAPGEPRRRVSQIRFRRLPAWSQTEISMANKYAETLRRAFIGPK